jgi:hypothetical protein
MYAYSTVLWVPLSLLLLSSTLVSTDQTVVLERFGLPHGNTIFWEPLFNPKSISAVVGEKIHFQTHLADVSAVPVPRPSLFGVEI